MAEWCAEESLLEFGYACEEYLHVRQTAEPAKGTGIPAGVRQDGGDGVGRDGDENDCEIDGRVKPAAFVDVLALAAAGREDKFSRESQGVLETGEGVGVRRARAGVKAKSKL